MKLFLVSTFAALLAIAFASDEMECPSELKIAVGSYSNLDWLATEKGKGVTIISFGRYGRFTSSLLPLSVTGENPSYCQGNARSLYCVNEYKNGTVTYINVPRKTSVSTPTGLENPTHLAVFPMPSRSGGVRVAAANYGGSGGVSSHVYNYGKWTANEMYAMPEKFPEGSNWPFDNPHPHMILPLNNGKFLVPDLSTAYVWTFALGAEGKLWRLNGLKIGKEDGPRHLVRGKGDNVYLVNEMALTVSRIRGCAGDKLKICETVEMLPRTEGYAAAAIRVSKDRKFLYASVRKTDTENGTIFVYALGVDGKVGKLVGGFDSAGKHPRDFNIIENGPDCKSYVVVAHRDSDNIVFFPRDRATGRLAAKPKYTVKVDTPSSVLLL